jgi:hypothetical protein
MTMGGIARKCADSRLESAIKAGDKDAALLAHDDLMKARKAEVKCNRVMWDFIYEIIPETKWRSDLSIDRTDMVVEPRETGLDFSKMFSNSSN